MKRGESGLSLLVGVDKPQDMSSHDVVNRVRRIFGERRVGHTGTLDPLATGVLPICVGPATRLDKYLTGHDKAYRAVMCFGFETTTDDSQGQPTAMGSVPPQFDDPDFAERALAGLVGAHDQVPPQYSAVKLNGRKAYEIARGGDQAQIPSRRIEVYSAELRSVGKHPDAGLTTWEFDVRASKGTYIRSLARDLGRALDCPAHLMGLRRLQAGPIGLEDCVTLETLETLRERASLDPVVMLGLRYAFADDVSRFVESGAKLHAQQLALREPATNDPAHEMCSCTGGAVPSCLPPRDGEAVAVVIANRLKAIYRFDGDAEAYRPECVFSTPVIRQGL